MKNFGIGLGIGLLGAIMWLVASLIGGVIEGFGGGRSTNLMVLLYIGGVVMVGGPLTWWIIIPIRDRWRKR
jgi:hypothetical protein